MEWKAQKFGIRLAFRNKLYKIEEEKKDVEWRMSNNTVEAEGREEREKKCVNILFYFFFSFFFSSLYSLHAHPTLQYDYSRVI